MRGPTSVPCRRGRLQLAHAREARQVARSTHYAETSDAVRREERQLEHQRIPAAAKVRVHVPEARDQVSTGPSMTRVLLTTCVRDVGATVTMRSPLIATV